MENRKNFRFAFFPSRLTREVGRLKRQFRDSDERLLENWVKARLSALIERIKALPMDGEAIRRFAERLGKMELRMLVRQYPYQEGDDQTTRKINLILQHRYTSEIGRSIWRTFQTHFNHWAVLAMLRHIFEVEADDFLGLDPASRRDWNEAFRSNPVWSGPVSAMVKLEEPVEDLLRRWKVKEGSKLERMLILRMLEEGLPQESFVRRTGPDRIVNWLGNFHENELKLLFKVYLEARTFREFDDRLMECALDQFGEPDRLPDRWSFLSEKALHQVKLWLKHRELRTFFAEDENNERFRYWSKYLEYIYLDRLQNPPILFMDFGSFVVVEFGSPKNAAYLYHKKGYDAFIRPKLRFRQAKLSESIFKTMDEERKGIPLFINRLIHVGDWQLRADFMIQRLIGHLGKGEHQG